MKRYTYSRTISTSEGDETFTADQFDSFDEAINAVNKGIYERELFLKEKQKKSADVSPEKEAATETPQVDPVKDAVLVSSETTPESAPETQA